MNRSFIISASTQTGLSAVYSEWFMNRIRTGFVKVLQPFSQKEIMVSLKPEEVEALMARNSQASHRREGQFLVK